MDHDDFDEVSIEETQDIPLRSEALEAGFILQPVGRLMRTRIVTAGKNDTVVAAAQRMKQGDVGSVLIVDSHNHLQGIFTERDVLNRVVAAGLNAAEEKVGDHMTANPDRLHPHDEVAYALNYMALGKFRHIPVVDKQGVLKGLFGIRDLKRLVLEHFEKEILTLPPHRQETGPSNRYGG